MRYYVWSFEAEYTTKHVVYLNLLAIDLKKSYEKIWNCQCFLMPYFYVKIPIIIIYIYIFASYCIRVYQLDYLFF